MCWGKIRSSVLYQKGITMKPGLYINTKGTVISYEVFKQLPVDNIMKTLKEKDKENKNKWI